MKKNLSGLGLYMHKHICGQMQDRDLVNLFISMAGNISEPWCCWISNVIGREIVNYHNRSIFLVMTFLFLLRGVGNLFPGEEYLHNLHQYLTQKRIKLGKYKCCDVTEAYYI